LRSGSQGYEGVAAPLHGNAWFVALVFLQYEVRLSVSQIQDHFRKVTIGPCKPTTGVGRGVMNGLRFMDET